MYVHTWFISLHVISQVNVSYVACKKEDIEKFNKKINLICMYMHTWFISRH